jgi:hypothetical protein
VCGIIAQQAERVVEVVFNRCIQNIQHGRSPSQSRLKASVYSLLSVFAGVPLNIVSSITTGVLATMLCGK